MIMIGMFLIAIGAYLLAWWGVWGLFHGLYRGLERIDPSAAYGSVLLIGTLGAFVASTLIGEVYGSGGWWSCAPHTRRGWPFQMGLGCLDAVLAPVFLLGNVVFWLVTVGGTMLGYAWILRHRWSAGPPKWAYPLLILVVSVVAYLVSATIPPYL